MTNWYTHTTEDTLFLLETDPKQGLTQAEAERRIDAHGPNELIERGLKNPWRILLEQLIAIMVVILIIAAVISALLGDYIDAVAIIVIVVLNAILGFTQEYRAEKAMAALKKLSVPTVKVRRDSHVQEISARELVPGDIMLLEAGGLVPSDARLLESINLHTQEAALTGESEPVEVDTSAIDIIETLPHDILAPLESDSAEIPDLTSDPHEILSTEVGIQDAWESSTVIREQIDKADTRQLEKVIALIRSLGVQVSIKVLHGTPFIAIIREVLWNGHDLVMITAENRRSLKNVLFGTTTMHLMRKCPCPVWVMKPDQPKQQKISWPLSIQPHLMRNGTLLTI